MNTSKIQKFVADNIFLPSVGIGICLLFWCFLSWVTWDEAAGQSDFPSPMATWEESAKYWIAPSSTYSEEMGLGARIAQFVTYPFSRNEDEGFDGMGLEVWRSLTLVGMGYGVAILAAIPIGFLLGGSPGFAKMFDPIFQILRPISPLAWFPLAGLLVVAIRRYNEEVDATQLQCVVTIAMCSIWPTILNTAVGVRAVPQDYLNVAKVLRLSPLKLFSRILLPATLPYMFTGFRLSLGIAWLVIVAAEMLSGKNGIGAFVNTQYQSSTYGPMIAAVILIGFVGFVLDRLMTLIERNATLLLSCPSILFRAMESLRVQQRSTRSLASTSIGAHAVAVVLSQENSDATA
ncbi:ABC transporter permease [Pirellulaceae bacterium SH501]